MKEVTIKIVGKHVHDGTEDEQMELITEAQMYERNNVLYILYEESEFTGMEGIKTRLRITDNSLKLSRTGKPGLDSEMQFEKGKRFEDRYHTPMGAVAVEMLTNEFVNTLSSDGTGKLSVDYTMNLKGLTEGRSKLEIEFVGGKNEY